MECGKCKVMIPKIIHYCWFGGAPLPPLAEQCLASWHKHMPGWEYKCWNEDSLTRALNQPIPNPCPEGKGADRSWLDFTPTYVRQAYEAKKYAFVSDYVRLWALEQYGGLYMDVDFEVYRSFDDLMDKYPAFAGYEGSKRQPVMQGVLASEPHGAWVRDMLSTYDHREFIRPDGSLDLTPNTTYFTDRLEAQGFVADGIEKNFYVTNEGVNELTNEGINDEWSSTDKRSTLNVQHSTLYLHVFPVHYFCPQLTTGENLRNEETYCEHKGESSWAVNNSWKAKVLKCFGPKWKTRLIKLKRALLG